MGGTTTRLLPVFAALLLLAAACSGDQPGRELSEPAASTELAEEAGTERVVEFEESEVGGHGDGVLTIGTLLPGTGSPTAPGPPEFAAAELAAEDVNDAGGVLGYDLVLLHDDAGDASAEIASQALDRHIAGRADVIVGAAPQAVIDRVVAAGLVGFSPAGTSVDLTRERDRGLSFRMVPNDVLQAQVLGELIIEDGHLRVGILASRDPYAERLLTNTSQTIHDSGGEITDEIIYDPQAPDFGAQVRRLVLSDPDAIVVIGLDESSRVLTAMIERGLGPADTTTYLVAGNLGDALGDAVDASLEGVKGTLPGSVASSDFQERLRRIDPDLHDYSHAGETYDAVVVAALAAEVAQSDMPADIAAEVPRVTREGVVCASYKACARLIGDGEDIDYDGQSGRIEMNDLGEPTEADVQILIYNADNTLELFDVRAAVLPE